MWVFLLLPAGACLSGLPHGGVLSLGWMCGWSYTRGTWGGLFFPRPVEEAFDRHASGPKRGLVFVFIVILAFKAEVCAFKQINSRI